METADKLSGVFANDHVVVDWQLVGAANVARYGSEHCDVTDRIRGRLGMHSPLRGRRGLAGGLGKKSQEAV
jgi:hypothetical protein